jgi:hypothetical protein
MGNQIYFKIAGKKKMDRRVEPPDTFLEENHPMTISSKFSKNRNFFKWPKLLYFKPESAQIGTV